MTTGRADYELVEVPAAIYLEQPTLIGGLVRPAGTMLSVGGDVTAGEALALLRGRVVTGEPCARRRWGRSADAARDQLEQREQPAVARPDELHRVSATASGMDPASPTFRRVVISHSLLKEGGFLALDELGRTRSSSSRSG